MKYILKFILLVLILTGCGFNKVQVIDMKRQGSLIGKAIPNYDYEEMARMPKEKVEKIDSFKEKESEQESLFETQAHIKVAFVYPSRYVAKYAKSSIATIKGYMAYKKANYHLKVIDSKDEDISNIQNIFNTLSKQGYDNVIALFIPNVNDALQSLVLDKTRVYLPLIKKDENIARNPHFIYGSISYEKQLKKLLEYSSNMRKAMFYQDSFLGRKIKSDFDKLGVDTILQKEVKNKRNLFKYLVNDKRLNDTAVFLNTDIVKSSLILSQMNIYKIKPKVTLATQINYDPKLISLTQEKDRTNFVVANSIGEVDFELLDTIKTFGGDIKYEWVDYSTLVGVNYLLDANNSSVVRTQIQNNEAIYNPRLFRSTNSGFLEIK